MWFEAGFWQGDEGAALCGEIDEHGAAAVVNGLHGATEWDEWARERNRRATETLFFGEIVGRYRLHWTPSQGLVALDIWLD